MDKKKAEAEPWKLIVGFIIVIVCAILIMFFFTDTFKGSSERLRFECWELEIPGRCLCENEADCDTREGREECRDLLREKCYG